MNESLREQLDKQMCGTGYRFKGMKADGTPDCVPLGAYVVQPTNEPEPPKENPTPPPAQTPTPPPEGASEIEDEIVKEAKRRLSRNNTRVNANGVIQQGTSMGNG
tara:strand:- start:14 stop:328 length:315 start_codon:yes stop_codon:yes gene_type:complete